MKKFFIILVFGLLISAAITFGYGYFSRTSAQKNGEKISPEIVNNTNETKFISTDIIDTAKASNEKVLTDDDSKMPNGAGVLASENYKIKEVTFAGELAISQAENNIPLQINNVRSELLLTKDQKGYKFVVSWQTNKLANSEIEYVKSGGTSKSAKELGYGFVHSVILADLEMASAYTYQIKAKDEFGNIVSSDRYSMYTSQQALSVFDLIAKEFSGIFGWAMTSK